MNKKQYYLEIARTVAGKSTCLRRHYGAILVKNDEIIATGYNGSPRGCVNCSSSGICMRTLMGVGKGDDYNLCTSVHAEMNCIISAPRRDAIGASLYIVGINQVGDLLCYANPEPCLLCHRMIVNAGIAHCYGLVGSTDEPETIEIEVTPMSFMRRMHDYYQKRIEAYDESVPDFKPEVRERLNDGMAKFTQSIGTQIFDNFEHSIGEFLDDHPEMKG